MNSTKDIKRPIAFNNDCSNYIIDLISNQNEKNSILVIGINDIGFVQRLVNVDCDLVALDTSLELIEYCSKVMPSSRFFHIEDLVIPDKILYSGALYKYIVFNFSLNEITDSKKSLLLNKMQKFLDKDGKIIIAEVSVGNLTDSNNLQNQDNLDQVKYIDINKIKRTLNYKLDIVKEEGIYKVITLENYLYIDQYVYCATANDLDLNGNINSIAILNIIQDIAGKHAEKLGFGYNDLIVNNYIWMLIRLKYTIKSKNFSKKLYVTTWQSNRGRVDFIRDIVVQNDEGEVVLEAVTKWCIVDYSTRKIIPAAQIGLDRTNYLLQNNERFDKIIDTIENADETNIRTVTSSMIDRNGHMNNSKYAELIIDSLPLGVKVKSFEINFIHESMYKDNIEIKVLNKGSLYLIEGYNYSEVQEYKLSIRAKVGLWED